LSFKDNEAAEALIRETLKSQRDPHGGVPMSIAHIVCSSATVEAMMARPTAGCKCKTHKNHKLAWTRTTRFGWWVHASCKRPASLVVKNYIKNLIISGGTNLLPEIEAEMVPPTDTIEVDNNPDVGGSVLPLDSTEGSLSITSDNIPLV
jgi:hypothetical protein